jgi:hypothetical protein
LGALGASAPWAAWGHLYDAVKTGAPGFVLAHGVPTYEFIESHPELSAPFNRWMSKQSAQHNAAIVDAYDFARFAVIADIGGGEGSTLAAALQRHPFGRGILFDKPSVVADRPRWALLACVTGALSLAAICWSRFLLAPTCT